MNRIYIAGCGGMLGRAAYEYFSGDGVVRATDIDATAEWVEYADVRKSCVMDLEIDSFKPTLIVNLAALTDLEYCEFHPDNAWRTNCGGAITLASCAERRGCDFVHISTAGIVDGFQDQYDDYLEPRPLSVYGKSKYAGELAVPTICKKHFVFRAGWMMGGGPTVDKKFVNKIYQQIKAGAKTLHVVDDKTGTPTCTKAFVKGIDVVVRSGKYGVYNMVCEGGGSRYDVAVEFVKMLGVDVEIEKVDSSFFAEEYFAPRPRSEQLVNRKLSEMDLYRMPNWRDALAEYVEEFREDLKR